MLRFVLGNPGSCKDPVVGIMPRANVPVRVEGRFDSPDTTRSLSDCYKPPAGGGCAPRSGAERAGLRRGVPGIDGRWTSGLDPPSQPALGSRCAIVPIRAIWVPRTPLLWSS
jgi:hypothetical protein